MASFRNYWSIGELLDDWRYWQNKYPKYNREKAHASWRILRTKWNIPNHLDIDAAAQFAVEGYPVKGPVG